MNIAPIAGKALNTIGRAPLVRSGMDPFRGFNPLGIMVASVILKDAVGMYYYVKQALNNDRIPEEKRKFVASMDLVNGVFNIVGQVAVLKPMEKFFGWIYDTYMAKKDFSYDKLDAVKSKVEAKGFIATESEFKKLFLNNKTAARNAFVAIGTLAGLQVLMKRVITPLFATPLATYVKPWLKDDKEIKAEAEAKKHGKHVDANHKADGKKAQPVSTEFKAVV